MEGKAFGRYRVTRKIAQGSMGAVYAAVHELMHMDAVVKVLLPEMSVDKSIVKRFFNEAQAAASIRHPGIVSIFDIGYAEDERAYIVMERLRGESLHARLQRMGRLPLEQALTLVRQLLGALGAAHERGIFHQNLKPGNLFIIPDPEVADGERIKVLDFGLAKLLAPTGAPITHTETMRGTPSYLAPEQCADTAMVDHRADLYAVGCLLYACLCGDPPFTGAGADILAAHLRLAPTPPRDIRPDVPPHLNDLVMRLLEKRPEDRPATCEEVTRVLDDTLDEILPGALDDELDGALDDMIDGALDDMIDSALGRGQEEPARGGQRADTAHDASAAVPVFQEPELCAAIGERGEDEETRGLGPSGARGGQRHTIPGLPFHYRPPGPCRHASQPGLDGEAGARDGQTAAPAPYVRLPGVTADSPRPRATAHAGDRPGDIARAARGSGDADRAGRASPARRADRTMPRVAGAHRAWSPSLSYEEALPDAPGSQRADGWTSPDQPARRPATAPPLATSSRADSQCSIAAGAAQIYWRERSETRRRQVWAGGVLLAALGALSYSLIAVLSASGMEPAAATVMATKPVLEVPAGEADGTPAEISRHCLDEAREAMDDGQWDRAMMLARQARTTSPDEPIRVHAAAIEDMARRERNHQESFEQLRAALTGGDMTAAAAHLGEIAESSTYREPALALTRTAWIEARTREAEALAAAGRCDEVGYMAERAGHVSAEAGSLMDELHATCMPAAEEELEHTIELAHAPDHDRDDAHHLDLHDGTPEELARETARAFAAQHYRRANRLCRKALSMQPDDQGLMALCTMSACRTHRSALARRYYEKAAGGHKAQIVRSCKRNGIDVTRVSSR